MLGDYILESCNPPGAGVTVTLSGNVTGRKSFSQVFATGSLVYYYLDDGTQAEWGYGTFTAGSPNTLSRTTVIGNTLGTAVKLTFSTTTRVWNSLPASKTPWLDPNGAVSSLATSGADAGNANLRMVSGSYGVILRNDGSNFYLMQTPSAGQYGTNNPYRPVGWSLTTGAVTIDGTGLGTTLGGAVGITGAATLSSTLTVTGTTTCNGTVSLAGSSTTISSASTTLSGTTTAISGTATLSGTVNLNGTLNGNNWLTFANALGVRGKDTSGNVRNVIWLDGSNNTTVQMPQTGTYFRVLNYSGAANLMLMDNAGNTNIAGTLSTGGNITVGASTVVTNNGGSYGISVTGTAGSVAWSNVSSKPYSFNQSADVGANMSFGSVGGTFLTSSGNIAPGWGGGAGGFSCRSGSAGTLQAYTFNLNWNGSSVGLWIDNAAVGLILTSSDARLKHSVSPMESGALGRILKLNPVSFRWKEQGIFVDARRDEGLIAQEVQRIIPAAVHASDDERNTLQLSPLALIGHLVKAVQELAAEVDVLRSKVNG